MSFRRLQLSLGAAGHPYAKKLIDEGALGDLTQYRGRFFSMYGSDPMGLLSWRFDREIAGYGVLGDIMAHVTDMALLPRWRRQAAGQQRAYLHRRAAPADTRARARIIRGARPKTPRDR